MRNRDDLTLEILELFGQLTAEEKKDFTEVATAMIDDPEHGRALIRERMAE